MPLRREPASVLEKARVYLGIGQKVTKEDQDLSADSHTYRGTRKYAVITPARDEDPLLRADRELKESFPNLIFEDREVDRVISWISSKEGVCLDIETYGRAKRKGDHKKEALSFVRGTIRLVQLSADGETFTLDATLLSDVAMARILIELKGKEIYLHNAIFDLPRILRVFKVDLLEEDVRDTMVLSRLLRSGQWEHVATKNGVTATANLKHNIRDVLAREIGVEIPKETDHRWDEPLTEACLRYASDDAEHLQHLYHDLLRKVEKDGMLDAYRLLRKVYPIYMRQQARGVPFDADLYEELRGRLREKMEILDARLREHAPDHPDEDGRWIWRNNRKPEEPEGRNGALRALELAGTPLPDLKKPTRLAYLKKHESALLLGALDQYLKHADLESDTRGWLDLYYEDGRLYPNVQFFSQVTGRSAYSGPAIQNIAKDMDLPGLEMSSFRDCVRVPGDRRIVKADYSAQELRILAHITRDENLLAAFRDQAKGGKDPHLIVGEKFAWRELERGTPEGEAFRQVGKRANYGFSYGAGWRRYQRSIYEDTAEFIPDRQAAQEKWAFEDAWPRVLEWQRQFGDREAHYPGAWYTTSFLGRRRYVSRGSESRPSYCDRLNGPIQQGGADMLYLALGKLLDDPLLGVHVIITTHDEIVLEAPKEISNLALRWLLGHMRDAVRDLLGDDLATEDCVEGSVGESWGGYSTDQNC